MVKKTTTKLKLVKTEKTSASPRYAAPSHEYDSTVIEPENLHLVLSPTLTLVRTFASEKAMQSYRRMLYEINKQGSYRYRTIRAEDAMWGIVIWRMV